MMIPVIWPYKMFSESAALLAKELDAKRVYSNGHYSLDGEDIIINWGNSKFPTWFYYADQMLNSPLAVQICKNKHMTFFVLDQADINCPFWTVKWETVENWLKEPGSIYVRHKIGSHAGKGIQIIDRKSNLEDLSRAKSAHLFTRRISTLTEYRIHVFKEKVFDFQEKKKTFTTGSNDLTYKVRNVSNGWIFTRENVSPPENVFEIAINAIAAIGLDFGAIDIILGKDKQAYVLEVNSAPGLMNTTLQNYAKVIKEYIDVLSV